MTKIIGLTGGIGSGKSTIMKYIESLGYKVYYSDEAGKKVMLQKEVIDKVVSLLGKEVLFDDGNLNRKVIAEKVFSNKEKLSQLNAIIHPAVARDFEVFVSKLEENEIVVKESALLFETKMDESCDITILVTAPENIRIQRVIQRDAISEFEVKQRIKNQMPEEDKIQKADFVINNLDLNKSFDDIATIFEKIRN
nr:dephospho-CoA kinase [uncultured Flavobacterium sp.]